MKRGTLLLLSLGCLLLIVGPSLFRHLVIRDNVIKLSPATAFVGPVSQSLAGSNTKDTLPIYGKDFTFQGTNYFDNSNWVVISIKPLNNNLNGSTVVLQKVDGDYKVVMGPGTAFSNTTTATLPSDVANYLNDQGMVYVSTN